MGEILRQPFSIIDPQDRLHLVWSGDQSGKIYYSSVAASQGNNIGAWLPVVTLPVPNFATWPQLGVDTGGSLYTLYTVPYNEKRRRIIWSVRMMEAIFGQSPYRSLMPPPINGSRSTILLLW